VLIPLLVNLVVGATLYAGLLFAGLRWVDAFVAGLPGWAAFLGLLLRVLLVVSLLIATGFVLVRFGVVLGAPWYARLSSELELLRLGQLPPAADNGLGAALRDLGRALAFELKKLLLALSIALGLLLLNLIPVVGTILATAGWIALGATIAAQLYEKLHGDVAGLDEQIARGEFGGLFGWLREHVHGLGARVSTQELLKLATGKPLTAAASLRYLEGKYLEDPESRSAAA